MLSQFISFFTDSLESGCTQLCSLTINHQHIIKEHHWVNLFTQYDWDQIAVTPRNVLAEHYIKLHVFCRRWLWCTQAIIYPAMWPSGLPLCNISV